MSTLGLILLVILVIILLGGVGPHFYQGTPWRAGYGWGNNGIGIIGIILIIVVVMIFLGYIR
jgi:Protein of unknown function (DUF3309)